MTNARYAMSNRQRKELLVRGRPLRLAIPCPPEKITDPAAFVRRSLVDASDGTIHDADIEEISVHPFSPGLGRIVPEGETDYTIQVAVVSFVLRPANVRGPETKLEWPGGVLRHGGREYKIGSHGE